MLSRLVTDMTSIITLRGSKAFEVLYGVMNAHDLEQVAIPTLVCKIQRLTFTQRLMQYTPLPKGPVTFLSFYSSQTHHPRMLFLRASKVTKQPLLHDKAVQVPNDSDDLEYKVLLNRLDLNHEAYLLMIYQEEDGDGTGAPSRTVAASLSELIEFQEVVKQPCTELTNTIEDLEEALDHLDSTIEEFSTEDIESDLIYNLGSTLETLEL